MLAERLCALDSLDIDLKAAGEAASLKLIATLVDRGSVMFERPDADERQPFAVIRTVSVRAGAPSYRE